MPTVVNIGKALHLLACSGLHTNINIPNSGHLHTGQRSRLQTTTEKCGTVIAIPSSVIDIESYTFSECSGLSHVTLPHSVSNIGEKAFYSCTSLPKIFIPNSVIKHPVQFVRRLRPVQRQPSPTASPISATVRPLSATL